MQSNSSTTADQTNADETVESQINLSNDDSNEGNEGAVVIKAPVCPFVLRTSFTTWEIIKVAFGTIVFAPIRLVLMSILILITWCLAFIGTLGKSQEEIQKEPFSWWRRAIRWFAARCLIRTFFFIGGFHWVTKRGQLASPAEAPILVGAPHSSYFDTLPLIVSGVPSVVARAETGNTAFAGKLLQMIQAVYVARDNYESRVQTIQAIGERVQKILTPGSTWPQLLMYPEGTCGNRSCIIRFKIGAFIPGVPIQPVLLRYPNQFDHITWTFDGPRFWKSFWLTLSHLHNYCLIEYLPVYMPSEAEKKDAALYANNVRAVMARALGIPTSEYAFEDGLAMSKLDKEQLINKLMIVTKFGDTFRVAPLLEFSLLRNLSTNSKADFMVTRESFAHHLLLTSPDFSKFTKMFECMNQINGLIDVRSYLVYACLVNRVTRVDHLLNPFFLMYSRGKRRMTFQEFASFMSQNFYLSVEDTEKVYASSRAETLEDTIETVTFSAKVKHRLEYLKLLALETSGVLTEYPPRYREIHNSKKEN